MILDIIAFTRFNFSNSTLRNFSENFKSNPISEIKEFLGECPSGWENFISEKWPGFVEGCDCTGSWGGKEIDREIHRGMCTFNETMAFCENLPSHAPLQFNIYRKKNLCKKRSNENYFDLKNKKKISKEANCGYGMKLCGKLDTAGNFLCVSVSEACPINQIIVQNFDDNTPTGNNYTSIALGNGKILYFTNQNATKYDSIYTDLRLSEDLPCLNFDQFNTKSRISKYILDANWEYYVCSEFIQKYFFDDRYKSIDKLNYIDLINDNKINDIINRYPQVPVTSLNFEVQIYARPYFGWKTACLHDRSFGLDFLSSLAVKLDSISGRLLALMIISIISFSLYLINFVFLYTGDNCFSAIFLCVIAVLNFSMIIIAFSAYSAASGIAKDNDEINNFACGDEYINMFLEYLFAFVIYLPGIFLWNGLLLVLNLVLKFCPFIIGYKRLFANQIEKLN